MRNSSISLFVVRSVSFFLSFFHTSCIKCQTRISLGKGTRVYWKSNILNWSPKGEIYVGNNTMIGRYKYGYHAGMPFYTTLLSDGEASRIKIGDNCRINGAYIHAKSNITIGNNCVIASGVNIIDSNGHQVKSYDRTSGRDTPSDIYIGNNVWIGLNAIILKGTHIGDNSIVAAGTVVKGTYHVNSIIRNQYSFEELITI